MIEFIMRVREDLDQTKSLNWERHLLRYHQPHLPATSLILRQPHQAVT